MLTWIIVAVVVVAVAALVWWTSGRAKSQFKQERLRSSRGISEGDAAMKAGRPTGGQFHPGAGGSNRF